MPATRPGELKERAFHWLVSYKSALSEVPEYGSKKANPNARNGEKTCQGEDGHSEDPNLWKKRISYSKETCETDQSAEKPTQERIMPAPIVEARIWVTNHIREQALEREFQELVAKWHEETWFSSSVIEMAMNQNYQRIIGMGQPVVPLILRELEKGPDHWFWALSAITGENPIKEKDAGNLEKMTEAWIALGEERGWI